MNVTSSDSTMRLDIVSAYAVTAARVLSWALVSAVVFRDSPGDFAVLMLIRGTIGFLNYTSLGLGPALIHLLSRTRVPENPIRAMPVEGPDPNPPTLLNYVAQKDRPRVVVNVDVQPDLQRSYAHGIAAALLAMGLGAIVLAIYLVNIHRIHHIAPEMLQQTIILAIAIGIGTLLRLASDAPGAVLQTEGRIFLDNAILVGGEIVWLAVVGWFYPQLDLARIGMGFVVGSAFVTYARLLLADRRTSLPAAFWNYLDWRTLAGLLAFGAIVAIGQLADFLYAPANLLLIDWYLDQATIAAYAPALQIDAALLLLVGGMAAVLLPKSALAHASNDKNTLRQYYLRGTIASLFLLIPAAATLVFLAPHLLKLWLGSAPPDTLAILPWVLIHTVIGASGAVGRSILIAMGKVKPLTIAMLLTGIANVALAYVLVRYTNLGLKGIVLATILVVTVRSAIWMPWYVMRSLKN